MVAVCEFACDHVCGGVCPRACVCGGVVCSSARVWVGVVCLVHTRVGSTTRLPSHSAQVKETRRSLYDSESGVKKMAVGHHRGQRSHAIE